MGRIGISGVDTRALTQLVREEGAPTVTIAYGVEGISTSTACRSWRRTGRASKAWIWRRTSAACRSNAGPAAWQWGEGYEMGGDDESRPHVVAVDYGNKRNIFRNLVEAGAGHCGAGDCHFDESWLTSRTASSCRTVRATRGDG